MNIKDLHSTVQYELHVTSLHVGQKKRKKKTLYTLLYNLKQHHREKLRR